MKQNESKTNRKKKCFHWDNLDFLGAPSESIESPNCCSTCCPGMSSTSSGKLFCHLWTPSCKIFQAEAIIDWKAEWDRSISVGCVTSSCPYAHWHCGPYVALLLLILWQKHFLSLFLHSNSENVRLGTVCDVILTRTETHFCFVGNFSCLCKFFFAYLIWIISKSSESASFELVKLDTSQSTHFSLY